MFIHFFAGSFVFLAMGIIFGWPITAFYLILGALSGFLPDLISFLIVKPEINGNSYRHRNNISHSIFVPLAIFVSVWIFFDWRIAATVGLAVLSHPFFDSFGLGWGVRAFFPFSNKTYKFFWQKKFVNVFSPEEIEKIAQKYYLDNWVKRFYFKWDIPFLPWPWSAMEWLSLVLFLGIIIIFMIK